MGLEELKKLMPARDPQIELLDSFVSIGYFLKSIVIHGVNSGKLFVLKNYFNQYKKQQQRLNSEYNISTLYIDCAAVISLRDFFSKTLKSVIMEVNKQHLRQRSDNEGEDNAENEDDQLIDPDKHKTFGFTVNKFMVALEDIIAKSYRHNGCLIYLIFENFTSLEEFADLTQLIAAFDRIQALSPSVNNNFTFMFLLNNFNLPYGLANYAIPTIFFENYKQDEVFKILTDSITSRYLIETQCQFKKLDQETEDQAADANNINKLSAKEQRFWENFVKLILDAFHSYSGSNLSSIIEIILKIWPEFTKKIFADPSYTFNDFIRIYRENQLLFKNESVLKSTLENDFLVIGEQQEGDVFARPDKSNMALPFFSKLILCSAYLASFVNPKYDFVIFSKLKLLSSRKTYRNRFKANTKKEKLINSRLLNPNSFELERMLAILHSLYRTVSSSFNADDEDSEEALQGLNWRYFSHPKDSGDNDNGKLILNIDFYSQFSNLVSLNLIIKSSMNADMLSSKLKFKVNFSYDFVGKISKDLNISLEEYLVD